MSNDLTQQAMGNQSPVSVSPAAPTVTMRDLADPTSSRNSLYDSVLNSLSNLAPTQSKTHQLQLQDVHYIDPDEDSDDEEDRAINERKTLGRRLRGTWVLSDLAGNKLDSKTQTLCTVPKVVSNGSVIYNGSRYGIGTQRRIGPGFYARVKKNGELESLANVERGTGARHRYLMDPTTGLFSFNVQNSKIPIADILDTIGATKEDTEAAWGKELSDANWSKRDPKATQKLFDKLAPIAARSLDMDHTGKRLAIKQAIENMRMDPGVNVNTIGIDTDKVDKGSILAATKKILELHKNGVEADDRDHASFQRYYGPEDIFGERIQLDAGKIRRQLLYKAQRSNTLNSINSGAIDKQLQSALMDSGVASLVDAPNPLDILDRVTRTTVYGDGGIGSSDSTPDSTRNVNHSFTGFIDGLRSVESGKVGADTFLAAGVRKGNDGNLYALVQDAKTGEDKYLSTRDVFNKVTSESSRPDMDGRYIGVRNGDIDYFEPEEIDYWIKDPETSYNNISNLVPGKAMMVPHRVAMATRMLAQSVELVGREAPLFQNGVRGTDGADSYEKRAGKVLGAKYAPETPGVITSVSPKRIEYVTDDGKKGFIRLAADNTLGRKSRLHNTPLVQLGQRFDGNQLLASSNFTDDTGTAALGTNLRIADMTHPEAYEDAYVVSESAAKNKLSSVGLYQNRIESDPIHERDTNSFISVFGGKFAPDQVRKLSKDGVIRVGQQVENGDPLILAMERNSSVDRVHRKGRDSFKDVTLTWDHDDPGEVVGVFKDKNGNTNVKVRTVNPLRDGDKIAMRNGLKGIVVIKPDSEMPTDAAGLPFEAIVPRLGVIGRKNPVVKAEVSLSKIARKRGEAYRMPDFAQIDDVRDYVRDELAKHQVSDKEDIIDGTTGQRIPGILTGEAYFTKLHHFAEAKVQGRATGRYTSEGLPSKGGDDMGKSKRIGLLAQHALLAGGGHEFLRGTGLVRGQADSQFMQAFMRGDQPPEPKVPERYKKFLDLLRVAGVNPLRSGTKTTLTPMTDDEIRRIAGSRIVKSGETIDLYKDQKPIAGGLMDPKIFGEGDQPARMILSESLPNPAYESAIKKLMGLKNQEFRDLIAGKHEIPGHGTGTNGLIKYLKAFDLPKELARARTEIKEGGRMKRDAAVKRLGFLRAMENLDVKPTDLMRSEVFVLPPKLRPISVVGNTKKQVPLVSDINYLYRELFDADSNLKSLKPALGEQGVGEERLAVYDALSALGGQDDTRNPELRQKSVKGALKLLLPGGPKSSYLQRKLIGNTADASGRGVIRPNSKLGMDDVGIPRKMAWDMFANHVVRDLVRSGMPVVQARESVVNKTKHAEKSLQRVMNKTPVLITRDPALHQFNTIGQNPQLVDGDTIQVNSLVIKSMGGDYDGNCLAFDMKIVIELQIDSDYTAAVEYFSLLAEELDMRVTADTKLPMDGMLKMNKKIMSVVRIGTLPRIGVPAQGKHEGQTVYAIPEGVSLRVLSYDHVTCEPVWADVTGFTVDKDHEVERVKTVRKRVVDVSTNESMAIYCTTTGDLVKRKASQSIGMFVPAIRKEKCRGDGVAKGFAWLLAAMTANGRKSDRVIGFAHNSDEMRTRVEALCRELFTVNFTRSTYLDDGQGSDKFSNSAKIHMTGNDLVSVMPDFVHKHIEHYGDADRTWIKPRAGDTPYGKHARPALFKYIPAKYFGLFNEDDWWDFLASYMENDGTLQIKHKECGSKQLACGISTSSPYLLEQFYQVLRMLGIRYTLGVKKATEASHEGYQLWFSGVDIKRAIVDGKLVFHSAEANAWLHEVKTTLALEADDNFDPVPVPSDVSAWLIESVSGSKWVSRYEHVKKLRKSYLLRTTAMVMIDAFDQQVPETLRVQWDRWVNLVRSCDITWDRIDTVEPLENQDVFDLVVPSTKVFSVNNGLVIYDTMSVHVPITKGEIDNLRNRLMPSKMLISPSDFKSPMYTPNQDYMLGVSLASVKRNARRSPKVFRTEADAERALEAGLIDAHDPVKILEEDDK